MNSASAIKTGISKKPDNRANIELLREIAHSINDKPLVNAFHELAEKIQADRFYLVIVGLFKRGKSSLINALIGQELAPVAVTPLTSVITFFEFGTEKRAQVLFSDGRNENIPLSAVVQYVSEEENPENMKQVQFLRIYTDAPLLEQVILVDTPGLGSLFSHNSDTTLKFLPKIDAALFVLSADIPISKTDEEFLMQMKTSIPNVLFVLNKADLLSDEELRKMVKYNLASLKKIFRDHDEIELIPVSSRAYFQKGNGNGTNDDGNLELLHAKIREKIIQSKDEILTLQSIRQIMALACQLSTLLKVKSDTLQLPMNELEHKRHSMQESLEFLAAGKEDFEAVIKQRIDQLRKKVTSETEQKRQELETYCNRHLKEESVKTWQYIKQTDANLYYSTILKHIESQYDELKKHLEETVRNDFGNILLQYSRQSQSFLNEIVRQMEQILGIRIEGIISSFDLDVYTSFYIYKSDIKYTIPSINEKVSYRFLPDSWVRRKVLNQIYDNCMEVVNPNAGRIRSDIDYKIRESFRKFKSNFNQKLQDLLESLRNMIDDSIRSKKEMAGSIEDLLGQIQLQQNKVEKLRSIYSESLQEYEKMLNPVNEEEKRM